VNKSGLRNENRGISMRVTYYEVRGLGGAADYNGQTLEELMGD